MVSLHVISVQSILLYLCISRPVSLSLYLQRSVNDRTNATHGSDLLNHSFIGLSINLPITYLPTCLGGCLVASMSMDNNIIYGPMGDKCGGRWIVLLGECRLI